MAQKQIKDRVRYLRRRRDAAGLKRVEVYVPADKADFLKAYAAQLREGSHSELVQAVRKLIAQAYRRFHASCLDNININPERASLSDAAVIAAALMHRGDSEAYKLGAEIRSLAR